MGDYLPARNNILPSDWITIKEAVRFFNKRNHRKIKKSDFYRHALQGKINLSIYFQSPIVLRRIKSKNKKLTLTTINGSPLQKLCLLDNNSFYSGNKLILSTEGDYLFPSQRVIDTKLLGYEYIIVQKLLAKSLNLPSPITGANRYNYGITVDLLGQPFQIFEMTTWQERIKKQIKELPDHFASEMNEKKLFCSVLQKPIKDFFPLYELPKDACIVIRHTEIEKLSASTLNNNSSEPPSPRISTPLSRLFWLACKHNDSISPLIKQPYKLLSIFEQWASVEGITDRLSGDTLKTALKRGSPSSF